MFDMLSGIAGPVAAQGAGSALSIGAEAANPWLGIGMGVIQGLNQPTNPQLVAAQQPGVVAAVQNGPFGYAAQSALASSSNAVFANQSPAALAALNFDALGVGVEQFTSGFANSFISPLAGGASNVLQSIPAIAWVAIAIIGFALLRRR